MITCLVLSGCLLTVTPTATRAADTIGERIATCANEALEPLCLLALGDEAKIAVDEGDACIPQSVSVEAAAAAALAYLRDELRMHPERAGNNEEDEEVRAFATLWPCPKVP